MKPEELQINRFKEHLRDSLHRGIRDVHAATITIAKHAHVYTCGDNGESVYYIESGQVKLLAPSMNGKECLLAILTEGDVFGELCLSGLRMRMETAEARERTILKQIPRSTFYALLRSEGLFEGFIRYLAARISEQQQQIADLVIDCGELRLGKILLQLARKVGKKDVDDVRIEDRFSHEELSEMVGTTRPRISVFMQRFRRLGLIEMSVENFLIIKEKKLAEYLARISRRKAGGRRSSRPIALASGKVGESSIRKSA